MSGLELGRLQLRSAVQPMFGSSGSSGRYQRLDQGGGSPASSSDSCLPEEGSRASAPARAARAFS